MKLRVLTWNIHKGIGGLDRRYSLDRVYDVLAHHEPDVVLLQEVDRGARRSRHHHQAQLLGKWLDLHHWTWFPNHRLRTGGAYGNAILSRWPLRDQENFDLTVRTKKKRSALHAAARVALPGGHSRTLHLFNVHLGLAGAERREQLERLATRSRLAHVAQGTPTVVGGDLNDVWGRLGAVHLASRGFHGATRPILTFPTWAPVRPLDALWVRGELDLHRVHRSRLGLAKQASDHRPLIAELELR